MSRKEDGIIVFPVFGEQFGVRVVRHFVLEAPIKASVVLEHTDDEPHPREKHIHSAHEVHCETCVSGQMCEHSCNDRKDATDDAGPACVRQTADRRVWCKHETFRDGIKPDFFEFVRHILVILLLVVRTG